MDDIDWEKQQQRYASRRANPDRHKDNDSDIRQAAPANAETSSQPANFHHESQNHPPHAILTEKAEPGASGKSKNKKFNNLTAVHSRWRRLFSDRLNKVKSAKQSKTKKNNNLGIPWLIQAIILLPFVTGLFIFGAMASPWNHVQKIEIAGNHLVSTDEIKNYSAALPRMAITHLKMVKPELEANLVQSNAIIKSATISTENWHDVKINIQEYRPIAYVKEVDFYYLVLENKAIVSEPVPIRTLAIPELSGFDETRQNDLVNELTKLPDEILGQINDIINVDGENTRIALRMNDGNIISGLIPTIAERMQYYPNIIAQLEGQTGLIDMEVGIYFTELTTANDPFATEEEQLAADESAASDQDSGSGAAEISVSASSDSSQPETVSSQATP